MKEKFLKKCIWIIVIFTSFFILNDTYAQVNLIQNPGFEQGIEHWRISSDQIVPTAHSGSYGALANNYVSAKPIRSELIPLERETEYSWSFWYLVPMYYGGMGHSILILDNVTGNALISFPPEGETILPKVTEWTKHEYVFTTPQNDNPIVGEISFHSYEAFVDDVILTPSSNPSLVILNIYAWMAGGERVQSWLGIKIWDGSGWIDAGRILMNSKFPEWHSLDVSTILNTSEKVKNARMWLYLDSKDWGMYLSVGQAYLRVTFPSFQTELYVNGFTPIINEWENVGVSPYLGRGDPDNNNVINAHNVGDDISFFTFELPPSQLPVCANSSCQGAQADCQCGTTITNSAKPWCCAASNSVYANQPSCQADPACLVSPLPGPSVGLINPLFCQDTPCVIEVIINFLFYLGSALIVLMIIIGAILLITSAGDPQKVSTAKRLLFWTVIGLAIILFAKGVISVIKNILGGG